DRDRLSLMPRTGSCVLQSRPAGVPELAQLAVRGEVPVSLARRAWAVVAAADGLGVELDDYRPTPVAAPAAAFALAERYSRCYAAAAAVQLWLRNREALDDGRNAWTGGLWLEAVLARVLERLGGPGRPDPDDDVLERLMPFLEEQQATGTLPSLLDYRLVKDSE
ncbi:hypothetical protein AB0O00_09105, partial [Kitasatospora sp. NPDC093558]